MTTLYDQYGRKVDTGRLKEEQAAATVAGIRNIYSIEHVAAGITAHRLASILQLAEFGDPYLYLEFCEDIEERDLHYLAVLTSRKESVAQLEPIIKPASEDAHDQKIADFVREALLEGDLDLNLFDILDALGKGFSVSEIIWDHRASEGWFPTHLKWRDPRWFMFDWVSGNEVLVRSLRTDGDAIPTAAIKAAPEPGAFQPIGIQPATSALLPFKFVVHVAKAKSGLPIRGGLARSAGWSYFFKQYVLKDWVAFAEIYGQPLRTGKYGPGATEQDKEALLRAVASIGTDAAAIIPDSMLIEFVQAQQAHASADLYEKLCTYLDDSVSKAVLGQTLTTQLPKGGGSRAAAQVHEAVRRDILAADAKRLGKTMTRDLVKPIVDLSKFGPQKKYPQFWLGLPDDQDIKVFADVVAEFVDRGLRVGQRFILDKIGAPEPEADEPCLEPAKAVSPGDDGDDPENDGADAATAAAQKKRLARRKRWLRY